MRRGKQQIHSLLLSDHADIPKKRLSLAPVSLRPWPGRKICQIRSGAHNDYVVVAFAAPCHRDFAKAFIRGYHHRCSTVAEQFTLLHDVVTYALFVKLGHKKFWADIVLVIHIRNTLASVPHGKKADQIRWIAPVDRLKRILPPNTPR